MHTLTNGTLTINVKEHGAELSSIRKGEVEYLWQADPAFWGRHSPVLFPIVGSVWEAKYRVGDKEFSLGQHGFARDMKFTLLSKTENGIAFRLESTEETLAKYPWPFVLDIEYKLHDNNVDVIWKVTNPGAEEMFFQIGAHPAFYYPDYDVEKMERGYLSFDKNEGLECIRIKGKGCVDAQTKHPLEVPADGLFPLAKDTFDVIDTIMMQDSQIGKTTLHRTDKSPWLSVTFDAPVVGIWSPPTKNAPFICLEPWYGRCDTFEYAGDYRDKDWMNRLAPGQTFSTSYTITLH